MKIAVIGLGYVGLPLSIEFSKHFDVIGFDINNERILSLIDGLDSTKEVTSRELSSSSMKFSSDPNALSEATHFIITVPTPVDSLNNPDMKPLEQASAMVGACIKQGDMIIYESTVYPGATEEVCIPILEKHSGLSLNKNFYVGYSPERINPGDKTHRLPDIKKVTSGSSSEAAELVDNLYKVIITAGTYCASSIKVAEAAKVIENTQRDINIALINELAIMFDLLDIDTHEVLEASGTKWNFLPFKPGLVGGHCIGVDPYYLTYKAQQIGYKPELILAGRHLNDSMSKFVASKLIKSMSKKDIPIKNAKILILGITFKENCPDIRNSKVIDLVNELLDFGCLVDVVDPLADPKVLMDKEDIAISKNLQKSSYDGLILAVGHNEFSDEGIDRYCPLLKSNNVIFDLKDIFPSDRVDIRL
ncbi:nucleotide sugar dehydrogenase [bacterium]|nr:nucleotide sugar dehydrogenase [bacterium]